MFIQVAVEIARMSRFVFVWLLFSPVRGTFRVLLAVPPQPRALSPLRDFPTRMKNSFWLTQRSAVFPPSRIAIIHRGEPFSLMEIFAFARMSSSISQRYQSAQRLSATSIGVMTEIWHWSEAITPRKLAIRPAEFMNLLRCQPHHQSAADKDLSSCSLLGFIDFCAALFRGAFSFRARSRRISCLLSFFQRNRDTSLCAIAIWLADCACIPHNNRKHMYDSVGFTCDVKDGKAQ